MYPSSSNELCDFQQSDAIVVPGKIQRLVIGLSIAARRSFTLTKKDFGGFKVSVNTSKNPHVFDTLSVKHAKQLFLYLCMHVDLDLIFLMWSLPSMRQRHH